jgi:hypothetical protein
MAASAGGRLHRNDIGQIERAESNPSLLNLVSLAAAVGVEGGELVPRSLVEVARRRLGLV